MVSIVISCLISRLIEDHKRVQRLANLVNMHGGTTFRADYHGEFSTNFVYVRIAAGSGIHSKDVVERLERVTEAEARELTAGSADGEKGRKRRVRVRAMAMSTADLRFALHLDVGEQGWRAQSSDQSFPLGIMSMPREKISRGVDRSITS